jgi:hypothetical protein
MKVGKNKIILYSWLPIGTYHKNLAIKKNYLENLVKSGLFCMENPIYSLNSYFSSQNLVKFHQ